MRELFPEKRSEKSSTRIPVLRYSDLYPSSFDNWDDETKIALDSEWLSTFPTSVDEKSGNMGTTTAPIKVIEKYAELQFGILALRSATLSPGIMPRFSSKAVSA